MKYIAQLTFLLLLLFSFSQLSAALPTIALEPATTLIERDSFFTVTMPVSAGSVNLKAFSVAITFNRSLIRTDSISIVEGPLLASAGLPTFFWTSFSPDSATIYIDGAILGDGTVVNGSGILATIRFFTVGFGNTDIAFASMRARDANNNPLSYDALNGWVKICQFVGDVNADNTINVTDVVYLIAWIFSDGPAPIPDPLVGDVDCSGFTNITDCVYLIQYIFDNGPAPCGPCY
jgi:hypothetical protein